MRETHGTRTAGITNDPTSGSSRIPSKQPISRRSREIGLLGFT